MPKISDLAHALPPYFGPTLSFSSSPYHPLSSPSLCTSHPIAWNPLLLPLTLLPLTYAIAGLSLSIPFSEASPT